MDSKFAERVADGLKKKADEEEMVDKSEDIDWPALETLLSGMLSIPITLKISKSRDGMPRFESNENLIEASGIFKYVFINVNVGSFSVGISEDKKHYWAGLDLSWKAKTGGTNGSTIGTVFYIFETEQWEFVESSR